MAESIIPVDSYNVSENFASQVTFSESAVTGSCSFLKTGKFVSIVYMGETKAHSANTTLFTLPSGYRPKAVHRFPFVKNASAYGVVFIGTDGVATVNQISSTSATGRIYFSVTFPV